MRRLIAVMTGAAASLPMTAAHAAPQAHHAPRAQAAAQAHTARGAKLEIRHTSLGSTLANGRGFTLYMFTRDSANHDRCVTMRPPSEVGSRNLSLARCVLSLQ